MKLGEAVSWYRGSMLPYESIGSIGAKFCRVNNVGLRDFTAFVFEHYDRQYHERTCFDSPGFDIVRFVKSFGERATLYPRLGISAMCLPEALASAISAPRTIEPELQICQTCLGLGYHSSVHQLSWLCRCFIHGEKLKRLRGAYKFSSALHFDISWVTPLINLLPKRAFCQVYDGAFYARLLRSARAIRNAVKLEQDLWSQASPSVIVCDPENIRSNAKCVLERNSTKSGLLAYLGSSADTRVINVKSAFSQLDLAELRRQLDVLLPIRRIQCSWNADAPSWRGRLINLYNFIAEDHRECLQKTVDLQAILRREHHMRDWFWSSTVSESMAQNFIPTCAACLCLDLIAKWIDSARLDEQAHDTLDDMRHSYREFGESEYSYLIWPRSGPGISAAVCRANVHRSIALLGDSELALMPASVKPEIAPVLDAILELKSEVLATQVISFLRDCPDALAGDAASNKLFRSLSRGFSCDLPDSLIMIEAGGHLDVLSCAFDQAHLSDACLGKDRNIAHAAEVAAGMDEVKDVIARRHRALFDAVNKLSRRKS